MDMKPVRKPKIEQIEPTPKPTVDMADFMAEPITAPAKSPVAAKFELVAFITLLIVSFVFGLQNLQMTEVHLLTFIYTFPLGVAMLFAMAVGGALMGLIWAYCAIKKKIRDKE